MAYGMKLFVDGREDVWLESYDHDANDGRGMFTATTDPSRALRFPDVKSVLDAWRSVSRTRPIRETDGRPNRPLTALTISPSRLP